MDSVDVRGRARHGKLPGRMLKALCLAAIPGFFAALLVPAVRQSRIAAKRSADK